MHIPASMLHGQICPVTLGFAAAVAFIGIAVTAMLAKGLGLLFGDRHLCPKLSTGEKGVCPPVKQGAL